MVSLKLRGPRRATSSRRTGSRSKSASASVPPPEDEDVDMEDTITVHRSPSPVNAATASELSETPASGRQARLPHPSSRSLRKAHADKAVTSAGKATSSETTSQSRKGGKGGSKVAVIDLTSKSDSPKAPRPSSKDKVPGRKSEAAGDYPEMTDADDAVEEYDFNNEPDIDDGEYNDDGLDTEMFKESNKVENGVITISSDDEPLERFASMPSRPWREMDRAARYEWESMYCRDISWAMNGDWSLTEDVLAERDKEMMRYLEDFPPSKWVLPYETAMEACGHLDKRFRWRKLGIRIYDQQQRMQLGPHGMHPQFAGLTGHLPIASNYPHGVPLHRPQAQYVSPIQLPQANKSYPVPNGIPYQQEPSRPNDAMNQPTSTTSGVVNQVLNGSSTAMLPPSVFKEAMPATKSRKRKPRPKPPMSSEEVLASQTPPEAPPYETRSRPQEREPTMKGRRRAAEAKSFPWNRQIDFAEAKASATWDCSIYDQTTLDNMEAVRKHNEPIIERIDNEEAARQRRGNKQVSTLEGSSDVEKRKSGRKSSILSTAEGGNGDPYHSGHYSFATEEDEKKAADAFGPDLTPDDVLANIEDGLYTMDECKEVMICWNPGKKGVTKDLKQVRFSIRDIILTRQQLNNTPILTRKAAECVVDFCPDMLWRGILLRVTSEAGYGNKDVRTRMCLNGNYCDKATITKRIGSALGQKQQHSSKKIKEKEGNSDDVSSQKIKGYLKGEEEYYNNNVRDHGKYTEYFGHRPSHRATLSLRKSVKRKARELGSEDVDLGSESTMSIDAETGHADSALLEDEGNETVDDSRDAVSIQSDTALDEMDSD